MPKGVQHGSSRVRGGHVKPDFEYVPTVKINSGPLTKEQFAKLTGQPLPEPEPEVKPEPQLRNTTEVAWGNLSIGWRRGTDEDLTPRERQLRGLPPLNNGSRLLSPEEVAEMEAEQQ